jgi:hypothetical protein
MGFQPTTPVFERAKMVHALDHAATVVGFLMEYEILLPFPENITFVN